MEDPYSDGPGLMGGAAEILCGDVEGDGTN